MAVLTHVVAFAFGLLAFSVYQAHQGMKDAVVTKILACNQDMDCSVEYDDGSTGVEFRPTEGATVKIWRD